MFQADFVADCILSERAFILKFDTFNNQQKYAFVCQQPQIFITSINVIERRYCQKIVYLL